jgi:hypothetical protein
VFAANFREEFREDYYCPVSSCRKGHDPLGPLSIFSGKAQEVRSAFPSYAKVAILMRTCQSVRVGLTRDLDVCALLGLTPSSKNSKISITVIQQSHVHYTTYLAGERHSKPKHWPTHNSVASSLMFVMERFPSKRQKNNAKPLQPEEHYNLTQNLIRLVY